MAWDAPKNTKDTLPETNIALENPPFWWYLPGKVGIFMGHVSFREGKSKKNKIPQIWLKTITRTL